MTITTADPAAHGFDPQRLARVDDFLKDRYVDTGRLPGVQLLISRDGEPVHFSTQGSLNEDGAPLGGRHDLPHRLHDEAHHLCGVHDAVRGRKGSARHARRRRCCRS